MSKYIKLEDAIHNIDLEVTGRKEYTGDMKANLFFALDELPTIEIVRCSECKYREKCEQIVAFEIGENQIEGRKIDFCSYGERKDNE